MALESTVTGSVWKPEPAVVARTSNAPFPSRPDDRPKIAPWIGRKPAGADTCSSAEYFGSTA